MLLANHEIYVSIIVSQTTVCHTHQRMSFRVFRHGNLYWKQVEHAEGGTMLMKKVKKHTGPLTWMETDSRLFD